MCYSSTYILFEDTHTTSATVVVSVHKNSWPVSSDLHAGWASGGWWAGRRDGAVVGCGAQNNPRVAGVGDDHEVPLFEDGQRGASALDRVQAAAASKLDEHSDACDHVVLLPEVELAVAKLLLVVDERRLLPVVFVRGLQVRNIDSSLALVYENDSQVRSMEKILQRINVTHIKKEFKLKTLFKQKKLHARLFFKYYSLHSKI
jgi:hypothetical protein